jgi:hypothetical protein
VRAFAQTYVVPFAVRALGHTRTRYGVTVKALLLATSNGSLFALPRRMLDPRRPVGRKATTTELEEGLATFDAYIPNDPRLDVGGEYRIEGAKLIVTASAMLESSSVVYVAGLDELLTRVAPSGTFDMLSRESHVAQTRSRPELTLILDSDIQQGAALAHHCGAQRRPHHRAAHGQGKGA